MKNKTTLTLIMGVALLVGLLWVRKQYNDINSGVPYQATVPVSQKSAQQQPAPQIAPAATQQSADNQGDPLESIQSKILALRTSGPRPIDMTYFAALGKDLEILLLVDTIKNRDALRRDRSFLDSVAGIINAEHSNHGLYLRSVSFISNEEIDKDKEGNWETSWMFKDSPYPKVQFDTPSSGVSVMK
jgi:hypothetical protein